MGHALLLKCTPGPPKLCQLSLETHHHCRLALLLEEAQYVTFKDHICALPVRPEVMAECFQREGKSFRNPSFKLQVGILVYVNESHDETPALTATIFLTLALTVAAEQLQR